MKKLIVTILALCMMSAPVYAEELATEDAVDTGDIVLYGNDQQALGKITQYEAASGMVITVDATNLTPGWHGFHVHEKGDCGDFETFQAAGGHAMMEGQHHGLMDESTPHIGDLPNIWAHTDGTVRAQFHIPAEVWKMFKDADGSAFMIHEGPDNYTSDPSGGAGARVACGVLFKPHE